MSNIKAVVGLTKTIASTVDISFNKIIGAQWYIINIQKMHRSINQQKGYFSYQSLHTGFLVGQLNASLNSRELAIVPCYHCQHYSISKETEVQLTMILANLGACGSV